VTAVADLSLRTEPVARLDDVQVVRGDAVLLRGVSWQLNAGERWVVLGPNGAGKTTLLQVAGGPLRPTNGTTALLG
jgi:iron complex transport system ATP-binding protein